jgi:hypothetical protein
MGGSAALSVVVAGWNGPEALRACLASLRAQAGATDMEVVVARNVAAGAGVLAEFPGAVDLALPAATTVPALRAAGLARSRGPIVAFIEDSCTCAPGWAAALLEAHGERHAAVGGPVDQAREASRLDWAVYFYDYGRYMPPCEAGPVAQLSGINMSFTRAALDGAKDRLGDGVFEADLQVELRRQGYAPCLVPGAVVTHRGHRTARQALGQAYAFARSYAARRRPGASAPERAALGFGALLLPAVLAGRIVAGVLRKRRHRITLLLAFPWLGVLLTAWSAGEAVGYVTGRGVSTAREP